MSVLGNVRDVDFIIIPNQTESAIFMYCNFVVINASEDPDFLYIDVCKLNI
jgi:hypothetical protein